MTLHELGLMVEENIGVSKMSEKFYKLTQQEWDLILSKVTRCSDLKLLLHLKVKDPFGDRLFEYKIADLAGDLKLSERTVWRSIEFLKSEGLIETIVTQVKMRIKTQFVQPDDISDSMTQMSEPLTEMSEPETGMSKPLTQMSHPLTQMSEPLTQVSQPTAQTPAVQSFENPSDSLQTNKDFKTHTNHPPARSVCVNVDFDEETREYIKAVANCQESEYSPTPVEQHQLEKESVACSTNPIEDKSSAEIDVLVYKAMIEKLGVRFEAVVKQLRENPENIQSAIASLQEAKDMNQCKNATGYLKKALIEGWMPEKQQYLAPLNATTKSPSQMSDEEWMIYLANTLTRERRNQLIRFTIPGALGERIAVLANGIQMSFATAKQMTIQQFEQMAMA